MAAVEMYDYLPTVAPDVDITLSVNAQVRIDEEGDKNIEIHTGDDGSEERVVKSNQSLFSATLQFTNRSAGDMGTVLDIYHDSSKANGRAKSFKWQHIDGHTYVVRFDCKLPHVIGAVSRHSIPQVKLKVLGKVADA